MIFAISDHIEQITQGRKTQTRRASDRYQVGKLYSIQPCRTCKGIPDGKILITKKRRELFPSHSITLEDAQAEGGYGPQQFERLYEKLHPHWHQRFAYTFEFIPNRDGVNGP